jgi:tellurite resistance protein
MTSSASPPSVREFDEPKLEALIETMFLAAFADGDFGDDERKQLISSVESLTDRAMSAATTDALLTRIQAELAASGRAARLASVKERLGTPGERKTALSLTIRLVAADGIIRTSERELILDVAEALEIDRDEAADLVSKLGG